MCVFGVGGGLSVFVVFFLKVFWEFDVFLVFGARFGGLCRHLYSEGFERTER